MKKKYSLLIGRWHSPYLHDGHRKLIQSVLDEGKNVCVAIRDTNKDKDNPYSFRYRKRMIRKVFPKVKVIKIPDTDDLVHGRDVGWKVRRIKLPKNIEKISATKIRQWQ